MIGELSKIVQEVSAAQSLQEALLIIVDRVKSVLSGDVCSIYLNDPSTKEHVLMATNGLRQSAVGKLVIPYGEGIVGQVSARSDVINIADGPSHANFKFLPNSGEAPYHGFIGVPIIQRAQCIGIIVVQQKAKEVFNDEEESFLLTLAAQLASSLSTAEIRNQLNEHHEQPIENIFIRANATTNGIVLGNAVVLFSNQSLRHIPDMTITDVAAEIERFREAVTGEKKALHALNEELSGIFGAGDRALFEAYELLLDSDELLQGCEQRITAGNWAPAALRDTIAEYSSIFEEMDDVYLAGRSADIRDIGLRILKRLEGEYQVQNHYPDNTILFGEEIGLSEMMEVPTDKLAGIVSLKGNSSSHVAVIAKAMSIPAAFGISELPLTRLNGKTVLLDGYTKRLCLNPAGELLREYQQFITEEMQLRSDLAALRDKPCVSIDGKHFLLLANAGLTADVSAANQQGAMGVGLYRTELLFHMRDNFPSEDTQAELYRTVMQAFPEQPVVFRTLDVGGDKPLPYFPIQEKNPFLGWRGIRISLDQVGLFKSQLRAIMKAFSHYPENRQTGILLPMITSIEEVERAKTILQDSYNELVNEGLKLNFPNFGVMIEVPAAAFLTGRLADMVDFFSIGSNDLTQYMLAVDRDNERVAGLYDFLHPAILYAINNSIRQARKAKKPISVCGEMAGDPIGALILMGMGITELSMSTGSIQQIKWVLRNFSTAEAETLLHDALRINSAQEMRDHYETALINKGLGSLIRPGHPSPDNPIAS